MDIILRIFKDKSLVGTGCNISDPVKTWDSPGIHGSLSIDPHIGCRGVQEQLPKGDMASLLRTYRSEKVSVTVCLKGTT